MSSRPSMIPWGAWPFRMALPMAAGYVGEATTDAFLKRVGTEYPLPVVDEGTGKGRRRFWLRSQLDRAVEIHARALGRAEYGEDEFL